MSQSKPVLNILTGPTAVGKTEAALSWAEKNNAEILSCDSVCVYRGMDIGSAKPTTEQQQRVRHHGIDLVEPTVRYSVTQYITYAQDTVRDIQSRNKNILITGGSGFYLAAFFGPVSDDLMVNDATINEVRQLQEQGLDALLRRLQEIEQRPLPEWLDQKNPIRVAKALERRLSSEQSLDEIREEFLLKKSPFEGFTVKTVLLERPDEEFRTRISQRTHAMLKEGLIEEAEKLLSLNLDPELPSARAVGYRATMDWLADGKKVALDGLAERINLDTWALVRKQRKWFKRLGLS
jgi:tRNA dimethylallyltransferase